MTVPFPSRETLLAAGSPRPEVVEEMYDLWVAAHDEAMQLAAQLPGVFGDPPRPAITLHVARGYDDEWSLSMERGMELQARDPEEHWYDVAPAKAQEFQEYFTFSDAEGWRFYLPVYLRHYLSDFPLSGYDAVIWACVTRTRFDLFTKEQIAFVERFLTLCRIWED